MAERIPQSTAIRVPLQAYLSSDHVSAATGKTIVITISKNGGAYANPAAGATNATEIASGSYYVDLGTGDTATLGPLFILGTCSGVDNVIAIYDVVKATNAGLTALPDTAATTNASLLTSGTGTDQLSVASGRAAIKSNLLTNTALNPIAFMMTDSTNHNPATGKTVTATRSIDGGAFGATTNSPAEIAFGLYSLSASAADLNGKTIIFRFTAASCDDTFQVYTVTP